MKDINRQWQIVADKINALSLMQRVLSLLAGLVCLYGVWEFFWHSAYVRENQRLTETLGKELAVQQKTKLSIQEVNTRDKIDPNLELRQRLDGLNNTIRSLDAHKDHLARSFIPPGRMVGLLRGLLTSDGLRLISLASQSAEPFLNKPMKDSSIPMIFRYGLQIEMEGDYFPLLDYLHGVEKLPLFWESIDYRLTSYPVAVVKLKVYTLSFQRE